MNSSTVLFNPDKFLPIDSLSPFIKSWIICGRVTYKSSIKSWKNDNGSGELFVFNLHDNSSEIKVTAFRKEVDKFFDLINVNDVYILENATIKPSKKTFSGLNHDFEIILHQNSTIRIHNQLTSFLKFQEVEYVKISELDAQNYNAFVNIYAVILNISAKTIKSVRNSDKQIFMRKLNIVDNSETQILFTAWNEFADIPFRIGSVICVKRVRVVDFKGRSLSTVNSTIIESEPTSEKAIQLKEWFIRNRGLNFEKLSQFDVHCNGLIPLLMATLKANVLPVDSVLEFNCKASILQIERAVVFSTCPGNCCRRLKLLNNGFYHCEFCNNVCMEGIQRIGVIIRVSDFSASFTVSLYDTKLQQLTNIEPDFLIRLYQDNIDEFNCLFESFVFQSFIFHVKISKKMNGEIKYVVMQVMNVNSVNYCKNLMAQINELM